MYIGWVIHTNDPATGSELVTYAARLVRVVTRSSADDSPAGTRLLSQLDELGPVSVGDLARADRTSQPTVSAAVGQLEERGLVTRLAHPTDARSTLVTLTDGGRTALTRARRRNGEVLDRLCERHGISPEAVADAVAVLRTLTTP